MPNEKSVNSHADDAIARAKADADTAVEFLIDACQKDKQLMRQFALKGIRETVMLRIRSQNDIAIEHTGGNAGAYASRMATARRTTIQTAYDYVLTAAGVCLGDAVKKQVLEQAAVHATFEAGNKRKKKWLQQIAKQLPDMNETRVRDVLGIEVLTDMFKQAK